MKHTFIGIVCFVFFAGISNTASAAPAYMHSYALYADSLHDSGSGSAAHGVSSKACGATFCLSFSGGKDNGNYGFYPAAEGGHDVTFNLTLDREYTVNGLYVQEFSFFFEDYFQENHKGYGHIRKTQVAANLDTVDWTFSYTQNGQ